MANLGVDLRGALVAALRANATFASVLGNSAGTVHVEGGDQPDAFLEGATGAAYCRDAGIEVVEATEPRAWSLTSYADTDRELQLASGSADEPEVAMVARLVALCPDAEIGPDWYGGEADGRWQANVLAGYRGLTVRAYLHTTDATVTPGALVGAVR